MNPHGVVMCCEAILIVRERECDRVLPGRFLQSYSSLESRKVKGKVDEERQ